MAELTDPYESNDLFVAVITARGGSKGLPRKNVLDLAGKPLIAWSIEAALKASRIDRVVVSTDCEEIAGISRQYGAEVPFMRPVEMASDTSPHIHCLQHALEMLAKEKYYPKHLVLLQPTSPYRGAHHIDAVCDIMLEKRCGSAFAVKEVKVPLKHFVLNDDDGCLEALNLMNSSIAKSQGLDHIARKKAVPASYHENGSVYAWLSKDILNEQSKGLPSANHCRYGEARSSGARNLCFYHVMSEEDSIDIDTQKDLEQAQEIMAARQAQMGK